MTTVSAAPFVSHSIGQDEAARSLVIEARVVCRVYTRGNQRITEYCEDGYLCGEGSKCLPGPAIRRKLEAERARRLSDLNRQQKALEQQLQELKKMSRQAGKDARRADLASSRQPKSVPPGGRNPLAAVADCSYKPAGGGAAWDAMCLRNGQWPIGATCHPGEVCPRDAVRNPGTATSGSSGGTRNASGNYQPGTWYTPNTDARIIPTPRYINGSSGPFGAPRAGTQTSATNTRPARNPAVPERKLSLRDRLRYAIMIQQLINLRDANPPGSNLWNEQNEVLKNLDRKLLDQGYDLSGSFSDVYNPPRRKDDAENSDESNSPPNAGPAQTSPQSVSNDTGSGQPSADQSAPSGDDPLCLYIASLVSQPGGYLPYSRMSQIPEKCRTGYGIAEALADHDRRSPTWSDFEYQSRPEIERLLGGVEDSNPVKQQLPASDTPTLP